MVRTRCLYMRSTSLMRAPRSVDTTPATYGRSDRVYAIGARKRSTRNESLTIGKRRGFLDHALLRSLRFEPRIEFRRSAAAGLHLRFRGFDREVIGVFVLRMSGMTTHPLPL